MGHRSAFISILLGIALSMASISMVNMRYFDAPKKVTFENLKLVLYPNSLVSLFNLTLMKLNISADYHKVVVGKSGWLFLGDNYESVLSRHRDGQKAEELKLAEWIQNADANKKYYDQLNIDQFMFFAPDKHDIYREYLPKGIVAEDSVTTSSLLRLTGDANVHLTSLKASLLEGKLSEPSKNLYFKGDSHWNESGAYIAYKAIVKEINTLTKLSIKHIEDVNFIQSHDIKDIKLGTAKLLKVSEFLGADYDVYPKAVFDRQKDTICIKNLSLSGDSIDIDCTVQKNNEQILYSDKIKYINNPNALNDLKVLYLRDSFGAAPSSFFAGTFQHLYSAHYYYVSGSTLKTILEKLDPDIVIFLIIERQLLNPKLLLPIT